MEGRGAALPPVLMDVLRRNGILCHGLIAKGCTVTEYSVGGGACPSIGCSAGGGARPCIGCSVGGALYTT